MIDGVDTKTLRTQLSRLREFCEQETLIHRQLMENQGSEWISRNSKEEKGINSNDSILVNETRVDDGQRNEEHDAQRKPLWKWGRCFSLSRSIGLSNVTSSTTLPKQYSEDFLYSDVLENDKVCLRNEVVINSFNLYEIFLLSFLSQFSQNVSQTIVVYQLLKWWNRSTVTPQTLKF